MKNPKKVNQIWLGSELPEREKQWVNSIREWCRKCNIEYKLWNIEELRKTFPDEPIWEFVDTLPDNVRKWVLLADYFRFIVINPGEVYCDTDFICTRPPKIDFDNKYVMAIGEYWNGRMAASGLLCIGKQFNKLEELKNAVRAQAKKLTNESLNDMCSALGPKFFRSTCNKLNLLLKIIPKSEATHWQWKNSGALIHQRSRILVLISHLAHRLDMSKDELLQKYKNNRQECQVFTRVMRLSATNFTDLMTVRNPSLKNACSSMKVFVNAT